ncbi:MAG: TraR/DksA family transcriptional regulator [Phycisphaeraceae bacterium]|nr:TraR/DksA family transcriptional regulator [Phycisphaeraceae bacterium]
MAKKKKKTSKSSSKSKKSSSKKSSTKKKSSKKKATEPKSQVATEAEDQIREAAARRTGVEESPLSIDELRKAKSGLRKREKDRYKKILLEKRAELLGDCEALAKDALDPGAGGLSHMPLHMADVGSDNYEHEFTLGLMESERRLITEIDDALVRIANDIYGVCLMTGAPIGKPRLDARPWSKYCIEAAEKLESQGKR